MAGQGAARPRSLLIEGWRGVNHSFALINQHQILALSRLPGLTLHHRDMPFAFGHWDPKTNGAGFSPDEQARIAALADPGDARVDCLYRICSPYRLGPPGRPYPTLTWMITELGLCPGSFAPGDDRIADFTREGDLIVTCTGWSRDRLVEYGADPARIRIIPLGVDRTAFLPSTSAERDANRAALGIAPDETVFLNVGVAIWNKGADLLLSAFARVRSSGKRVRLVVKDQSDVYGIPLSQTIAEVGKTTPALLAADTLSAISVVSNNMSQAQLRALFGVADCYVSAYRAEGFNLPVLEAIACGVPVIVPRGGATDDFCADELGWRIAAKPGERPDPVSGARCRFNEPDLDELTDAMLAVADGRRPDEPAFAAARERTLAQCDWQRAAVDLAALVETASSDAEVSRRADGRVRANSFDVFDTLIARRCLDPWRVFDQVGAAIGRSDFTTARITAEARLAGTNYTLDDIYGQLAILWELSREQAMTLRDAELAAELANVIPITENLGRLRHGDLLISDMYLPESAIRDLLVRAGLDKRVGLVVSTQGKRAGHIWPAIGAGVAIARHLGDNQLADVTMPTQFGIAAEHTDVSAPTLIETWLAQHNLSTLALLAREARLRTWHPDPAMRGLQKIQAQLNFPILLLSTVQLLRVAAAEGADHLLFCSRDCDLWLDLFRTVAARRGIDLPVSYFYTSRIARRTASPDYLAYASALFGEHGLVVDICGTGWSLSHLMAALGMRGRPAFFIHQCEKLDVYEQHAATPAESCTIHTAIRPERPIPNVGIEMVNTADHGSVLDVRIIAGTPVPVLDKEFESPRVLEAIRVQRRAFLDTLAVSAHHSLDEVFALSEAEIATVVQALYEHLHAQPELAEVFLAEYRRETRDVHAALSIPVP